MYEVNQKKVIALPKLEDFEGEDWRKYLIVKEPPEVPALISIGEIPTCTPANHSLLLGKKKARKTLVTGWLISQYTGDLSNDVLIADTEQGAKHVWRSRDRIYRLTGKNIHTLSLRGQSPDERRNIIEQAISDSRFKIVVIDGIRDLLSNINDPDQCTDLVTWIEKMTVTYNLHIINVLHLNKVDNNARGHIGSELLNKAETTIELELDAQAGCTIVKCESSRDIPFESFAITHDVAGLPEIVSMPIKGQTMTDAERKDLLQYVFEGGILKYQDVIEGIRTHFKSGKTRAEHLLGEFIRMSWIIKEGKDRSPATVYKLMIGKAMQGSEPVKTPP